VFDDIISTRYSQSMQEIFLSMRNSNISGMVCIQHPAHINLSIRGSVYNELWFKFNNLEMREKAKKYLLRAYIEQGILDYDHLEPYTFFYINNKDGNTGIYRIPLKTK
jgi:hypothetical protein